MSRANARRMVTHESQKCRSGRDADRMVGLGPCRGRGGKTPRSLGGEEGEARQRAGDVVVPASVAAAFKVIKTELVLQILVDPLGVPAFLEEPDQVDKRHPSVGRKMKVSRLVVVVAPLTNEPHPLASTGLMAVVGDRHDAQEGEPCGERRCRAVPPGVPTERTLLGELGSQRTRLDFVAASATERVDHSDLRDGPNGDRERCTPTEWSPFLRKPVSSMTHEQSCARW